MAKKFQSAAKKAAPKTEAAAPAPEDADDDLIGALAADIDTLVAEEEAKQAAPVVEAAPAAAQETAPAKAPKKGPAPKLVVVQGTLVQQTAKYFEIQVGEKKAWWLKDSLEAHEGEKDGGPIKVTVKTALARRKGVA